MSDPTSDQISDLSIREVDVFDAADFEAWHAAYAEALRHGREDTATVWTLEELRILLQDPGKRRWTAVLAGVLDGEVVATASIGTPLLDNLDTAEVEVQVVPEHRRRGLGSAMLARVEQLARERGRTLLNTEAAWPHDADPRGAGEPGVEFLRRHGFDLGLVDVQRQLALPVADELLDRLAARAAPHHAAYTLHSFAGRVPDELVEGWVELAASLMTEAPTGEIQREAETPDVEAHRHGEDVVARQGRRTLNTLAVDADGRAAAYTELVTTVHEPGRAYQWGTLVRRADRGHRLGLAVKVANLRLLQRESPGTTRVVTWNAEVNEHMVGVNADLGFVASERLGEFQRRL